MKEDKNLEKPKGLEKILKKTVDVLEDSKKDIFSIFENSRKELNNVKSELDLVNDEINDIIDKLEKMEKKNHKARVKLMKVSGDIVHHTEDDIKKAYKEAEKTTVKIAVLKEKEEQLKQRRQELESRIINLRNTGKKAEDLVSKVGLVRDYLFGELNDLSDHFDDIREKQKVALKVIQAQEEERKRVAREIHDGPAQSLANLVFRVELAEQLIDKDKEKAKKELVELEDIVRLSVKDVRKIIYDLRPMSLDDLGLIPTLKRYINNFIQQTGIMVELRIFGSERRLPSSHEVTIFRLVQEALNNVYKHAGANSSKVSLEFRQKQVNLLINDDGEGFDMEHVEKGGFGLISMRERCELLGGNINIKSEINKGTRIKIIIPIERG